MFERELWEWLDSEEIEIRDGVWLATADTLAERCPGRDWLSAEIWLTTDDGQAHPVREREDLPAGSRLVKDGVVYVINPYGRVIYYQAAENLMDAGICNDLAIDLAPCTEQEFFDAYCKAHEEAFGEEFEPAKSNPVW